MLNTKNLVTNERDIPSYWVFRYYLNINEELTGQDLKIKSVWNPGERTPSLCVYVDVSKKCYMYKDFSTGKGGNKINLLMDLFNLNYSGALEKMIKDYNVYVKNNGIRKNHIKPESKWELELIINRPWTENDAKYWLSYRIGSSTLKKYNVRPIEFYNMVKRGDNPKKIKIESNYLYGYYNSSGDVYKIYQPYNRKHKFHKVIPHIQGLDQLEYKQPYLVITKALKDIMCLDGFGYNIELIAPDSENTIIKPHVIENLKQKYKKIITLFDNDDAGKAAVEKYKKIYNLHGATLKSSKDSSDLVKDFGFGKAHHEIKQILKETIHK